LTPEQSPADIPRDSFTRGGWRYTLTDITERRTSGADTRSHTETVEINTETKELNEVIALLAPTLDYEGIDGYCGLLTLDLLSVKCEAAGHQNISYTVTATREYPHLSANDLSLIPKTITDNNRTLELDDVKWEIQHYINVDYEDIPDSYRAVASYSARATRSVVTGYITTADYIGEVSRTIKGDTVYTAFFDGVEINPPPAPMIPPVRTTEPEPTETPTETPLESETPQIPNDKAFPLLPIVIAIAVLAAVAGVAAFFFMRRNVKVYRDDFRVLVAKDKINAKNPVIDLSPLEGDSFGVELDKLTAKSLNSHTIEIRRGPTSLKHKVAYEGNAYRIMVDFGDGTIHAVY
jgi:hypothetical protein